MKHSKMTAIVLTLCMLVTLLAVAPAAVSATTTDGNFLKDGSFETWGPTGEQGNWVRNLPGAEATIGPDSTEKADGGYSIKFAGKDITNKSRQGLYQVIGAGTFSANTYIKVSVRYYVKQFEGTTTEGQTPYYSLAVRRLDTNNTPICAPEQFGYQPEKRYVTTEGWQEFSAEGNVSATSSQYDLEIYFEERYCANFEIYIDDFKVEIVDKSAPSIKNGDFEVGTTTGWTAVGSPSVVTEEENYVVTLDTKGEEIKQTVTGLTVGKKYIITFDICSNGAYASVYFNDSQERQRLDEYNTDGKWEHHGIIWNQNAADTDTLFQFKIKDTLTLPDGAYVKIDNVVLMEADTTNLVENGSFEYGKQGLGLRLSTYAEPGVKGNSGVWQTYSAGKAAGNTKDTDCVEGSYSMKITDAVANNVGRLKHGNAVTVEEGKLYEATFYVKDVSLAGTGNYAVSFYSYANVAVLAQFTAADLPDKEWVCIRVPYIPAAASETPELRFNDNGVILVDNFSLRKVTEPVLTYADANGIVADSLVDGGKATITMPVVAADAGNIYALALYNRTGNMNILKSVKVRTIADADVTAGYASFTLAADTLGADFSNVNYAKLIALKGGSYAQLQEYDLLVKAQ